jgi:predicted anti-sigma-YlaC factor YlaD
MAKLNCERVCMAAMAMADGYQSELSSSQIEAHLVSCAGCRREVGQLRELSTLLDAQQRRQRTESVWNRVEGRLSDASSARSASRPWRLFMLLGMLLLGYRILEMVPDRDFGFLFKLVPVLLVIAAFGYLKENPFKIESELRLEGE